MLKVSRFTKLKTEKKNMEVKTANNPGNIKYIPERFPSQITAIFPIKKVTLPRDCAIIKKNSLVFFLQFVEDLGLE